MRVAVDNRVAARKPSHQSRLTPGAGAGDVNDTDPGVFHLDDPLLRQQLAQRCLVGVAVHRLDLRAEPPQLLEDADGGDVARVDDQIRALQQRKALVGEPARPAR